MNHAKYDVTGIGNAIVDVLARADDPFLEANQLSKGAMMLVDAERAHQLHQAMLEPVEACGGSAGNTIAGLASLGRPVAYIGKVADDALGAAFARDLRALGSHFDTTPLTGGPSTARCLIFVTPDAQRTMSTYLGACTQLGPDDVNPELVAASKVTYLEGYLWDPPLAKEAFVKAAKIAHEAGRKVSLSLSDAFCVDRHREDFLRLVDHHIDVLFANENEIFSLFQCNELRAAVDHVSKTCEVAVITRSAKGSLIVNRNEVIEVPAAPVSQVVDTTGAGDLYAAGFLYGYTQDLPLRECGALAAECAAEVISHYGARPAVNLGQWIESRRR